MQQFKREKKNPLHPYFATVHDWFYSHCVCGEEDAEWDDDDGLHVWWKNKSNKKEDSVECNVCKSVNEWNEWVTLRVNDYAGKERLRVRRV